MKKNMNILDFRAELEKKFPRIVIVAGEDPTLGEWVTGIARTKMKKKLGLSEDDKLHEKLFTFSGAEINPGEFHSQFFNLPLFPSERLFIVLEAQEFFNQMNPSKGGQSKANNAQFKESIKNYPEDTTLVLISSKPDVPASILKLFPDPFYYKNRNLYENEKSVYVHKIAEEQGVRLDESAVDFLIDKTEGRPKLVRLAMVQISRIKEKFPPGYKFTHKDLHDSIDTPTQNSVFKFIEHLFAGKKTSALKLLPNIDLQADSYLPVMSLLLADLVRIRRLKAINQIGTMSDNEISDLLKIPKNSSWWRQKKLQYYRQCASLYGNEDIAELSLLISEIQFEMKSGLSFPDEQFHRVQDLCLKFPSV